MDNGSGLFILTGEAWGQSGSVSAVEFRVDDGSWQSASFNESSGELGALERFTWTVALDSRSNGEGQSHH